MFKKSGCTCDGCKLAGGVILIFRFRRHDACKDGNDNALHSKDGGKQNAGPGEAEKVLGWKRKVDFPDLVKLMVEYDIGLESAGSFAQ